MTHKKNKSNRASIDHAKISAKDIAKASSSLGPQPTMNTKHDLPNDADEATASDRWKKRRKINSNTGLDHHDQPSPDIPETAMMENSGLLELASDTSVQELPPEVRHLSSKYDFTTMSILSSAKISDKVKKLLLRVEKFSFADPKSKPGVVILHAKSKVASKLVSIVEIAQKDIEHRKGNWWQYSKVNGHLAGLKMKSVKRRDDGKTLSDWQKERAGEGSQRVDEVVRETGNASEEVQQDHEVVDGDEEMEDAFECMVDPKNANQGAKHSVNGNSSKIRATPVMTIYFARVPVLGMKELYGEQTNARGIE